MKKTILGLSLIALLAGGINNSYSQSPKLPEENKLIIYGDSDHGSKKQEKFIKKSRNSLKKQGYNYFAVELPKKDNESIQKYFSSNKCYRNSTINGHLNWYPSKIALDLCYKFYKKGFKIVPIDEGHDEVTNLNLESFFDALPQIDTINNERDFYMAQNIEEILKKDSSAKVVVYVGANHAREIPKEHNYRKAIYNNDTTIYTYLPMAGILKEKGIDPQTIYLKSKERFIHPDREINKMFKDLEDRTTEEEKLKRFNEQQRLNEFFDKKIYLE